MHNPADGPVVLHLTDEEWTHTFESQGGVDFASASSASPPAKITVFVEDREVECVNLSVPHSWWPSSGQPFCPSVMAGETLRVVVEGSADVRIDLRDV